MHNSVEQYRSRRFPIFSLQNIK